MVSSPSLSGPAAPTAAVGAAVITGVAGVAAAVTLRRHCCCCSVTCGHRRFVLVVVSCKDGKP